MDPTAYLLGKYLAQLGTYVLMLATFLGAFFLYAFVTNFAFTANLLGAALLSVTTASAVVAIGILLSTLNRSARGALFALLAVVFAFLVVQLGHDYVSGLVSGLSGGRSNPLQFLQTILGWLDGLVSWLSPFAHLERGIDALLRNSIGEYALMMGLSLLFSVVAFGLAVRALRRKGVR